MIAVTDLRPGDCLLYRPKGVFGWAIAVKTWHAISHVEVYNGDEKSWASRDGVGVALYPWRSTELAYVLRPRHRIDIRYARAWATWQVGTPYGWLDLFAFFGLPVDFRGVVCSAFATRFYRMTGWNIFPTDDANAIAPFEFLTLVGNGFTIIYQA